MPPVIVLEESMLYLEGFTDLSLFTFFLKVWGWQVALFSEKNSMVLQAELLGR
jgi:hypothetical protein